MNTPVHSMAQKNATTAMMLFALVGGMVGLAYASVPLYEIFCRVTGFGGTTQVSALAPGANAGASLRSVRFNAHITPALDWSVTAPNTPINIRPGEEVVINYTATNPTDAPITGTSSYNVTPHKIGVYFSKIECFCFTHQTLAPGETVEMPVRFYLAPEIDADINTIAVPEITLSYTFFKVKDDV